MGNYATTTITNTTASISNGIRSYWRDIPDDRRYSDYHTWIKIDGVIGTIGISDHAQRAIGKVTYVGFPDKGAQFDRDDVFGNVVSGDEVDRELVCPMSGEVIEINPILEDKQSLGLINTAPYDDGWILKIRVQSLDQFGNLKTSEEYRKYVKIEPPSSMTRR
ncbi:glycine cleavage system H protein-like [Glandiceps talaboti]